AAAALIGNAYLLSVRSPSTVDAIEVVRRTLREDPPTLATRRMSTVDATLGGVAVAAGAILRIDLAAAERPFRAGPHASPRTAQAVAIATGAVAALRRCRPREDDVAYLPTPNLRVPTRILVSQYES